PSRASLAGRRGRRYGSTPGGARPRADTGSPGRTTARLRALGYPLPSSGPNILRCLLLGRAYQDPVRCGVNCERLLDEPVEEHPAGPRRAPVEPERELIEVVGEVLAIDGTLVGAEEPSLEQRGHPVDAR